MRYIYAPCMARLIFFTSVLVRNLIQRPQLWDFGRDRGRHSHFLFISASYARSLALLGL